ncbi:unnamed protein product [Arctogadus glacialis]
MRNSCSEFRHSTDVAGGAKAALRLENGGCWNQSQVSVSFFVCVVMLMHSTANHPSLSSLAFCEGRQIKAGPSRRYARPLKRSACPASAQSGLTANPSLVTDWFGRIWFGLGGGRTGSVGPAD